jgi:hypothetical protein
MSARLQLDSHHYKCRLCNKLHVGPTRTLDFECVQEVVSEKGVARILEADFVQRCDCDQMMKIRFQVREFPPGIFSYRGCQSSDVELLTAPRIREHEDIVDD